MMVICVLFVCGELDYGEDMCEVVVCDVFVLMMW